MVEDNVVFEDPPSRQATPWMERLTPLMEHPGRWAKLGLYPRSARSIVSQLNRRLAKVPPGAWEFVHNNGVVYGRYLGEEPPAPAWGAPPGRKDTEPGPKDPDAPKPLLLQKLRRLPE